MEFVQILRKVGYSLALTLFPVFSIYAIMDYRKKFKLKKEEK